MICLNITIAKKLAGILTQHHDGTFAFCYESTYSGLPVSLTLPIRTEPYFFDHFPPCLVSLLPQGIRKAGLLDSHKLSENEPMKQLEAVGRDLPGTLVITPPTK